MALEDFKSAGYHLRILQYLQSEASISVYAPSIDSLRLLI